MKKISIMLLITIIASLFSFPYLSCASNNYIEIIKGEVNEWEAEENYITKDKITFLEKEYKGASGDKGLVVSKDVAFVPVWPDKSPAELTYNIDVKEDGIYYLWMRARANDTGSDSAFVFFDNAFASITEFDKWGEFQWYIISTEYLSKGLHTINFLHRERNVFFDKFILTSIPDYAPGKEPYSTPEFLPSYDKEEEYFYPLPYVTPPKNEHPRLFLRRKDIPKIKKNLTHPQNIGSYNNVLTYSSWDYDGNFPPLSANQASNVIGNHLICAESCAFLYLMNNDVNMGIKAKNIAMNAMRTMTNRKGGDAATRTGGNAILICFTIYDWCYDLMTDEERKEMRSYLYLHISITEIGWPAILLREFNTHAQEGLIWLDILSAGIAVYDEDPKLYNMIAGRLLSQSLPIKNLMYDSVFTTEGSNYGPFRLMYELFSAWIFKAMGYDNLFNKNQHYQRYGDFYLRRPDGRYIKSGDDAQEDNYGFMIGYNQGLFLSANLYKDPYLKREFYRSSNLGVNSGGGAGVISAPMHLIINDVNVAPNRTFRDFPLTIYGKTPSGQMVARTSWNEGIDSDAMIANMYIGERFYGGHQHLNSGHFDIYYKGSLAIDSGIYEGAPYMKDGRMVTSVNLLNYGSEHDFNYHKRTIAHNAMLVYDPTEKGYNNYTKNSDGGQRGGYGTGFADDYDDAISDITKTGFVISHDYGPDLIKPKYSYLKGDIKDAYTDKVKNYQRTFMFLNFFDETYPGALIVLDNIESKNASFKKTWLLHSQEEPEVKDNVTTIKRTEFGYNGRLINDTLLPKNYKIEKVGGPGKEFLVNGVNYIAVPKSKIQEAGNYRIELSPYDSNKKDYFLNVMQVSKNDDSIKKLPVTLVCDNNKYAGIEIKDYIVYLRKDDYISSKDIEIELEEENSNKTFIIDGLKEGLWKVYDKNNKLIKEEVAYKNNNTISFEAKKGKYIIRWEFKDVGEKDFKVPLVEDENPIDVKLNFIYESFINKPFMKNNNIYVDVYEMARKTEDFAKIEDKVITFKNNTEIDVENKTFKSEKEKGKVNILNERFISTEEFAKILKYDTSFDKIANISYIKSPESNIDKYMLVNSDDENRMSIHKIKATPYSSESPYSSCDGNIGSYWAASGKDMWITYEFEKAAKITDVEIMWLVGHTRKERFKMEVSKDGKDYKTVFDGESDGMTNGFEKYAINTKEEVKYLKITGYGNSSNAWNSLCEIRVYKEVLK